MRIVIFSDTYYPDINGVVSSIGILRKELIKHGHEVMIVTTVPPKGVEIDDDPMILRMNGRVLKSIYGYRLAGIYNNEYYKKIREFKPHLIHTQTEYGVGIFGRICAYYLDLPHVYTYHTNIYDYTYYVTKGIEPLDKMAKWAVKQLMKVYTNHCTSLIVPSDKTATMMKSIGIKKEPNVVATGLDLDRFKSYNEEHTRQIRKEFGLENHFIMISIGRLAAEKSIDLIIKAMPELIKKNNNIKLFIVGDGPAKEELMNLTDHLHMNSYVIFAGSQKADTISDYYHAGDLFVSASMTETQGLTFIEAMASSLPVIARYDSNLDPVISEGENGHFFYNKDEYIQKVIELSHKDLRFYKRNAVKHADLFNSDTFYKGAIRVYDEAIKLHEECYVVQSITSQNKLFKVEFVNGKRKINIDCNEKDIKEFHIDHDMRVSQEVIDILKDHQGIRQLYFKAVKLLSYHDYCFSDLYKRLEKYGDYTEEQLLQCMSLLTDRHLIDDRKYVRSYIEMTLKKGKGFKKAIIDLKNKDIPEGLIEEEIQKFDENDEKEYALNIVNQLYNQERKLSPQAFIQKIKRTLFNKGFSEDTVISVMSSYDFEFSHERTLALLKKECEKVYKRYQNKYQDQELKMKVIRFLKQKGYDYEDILIVIDEIWSELND